MPPLLTLPAFASAILAQGQAWKPAKVTLTTQWGKKVTPENARQKYPRPQSQREAGINLNGLWNYAVAAKVSTPPTNYDGQILVPFCIESSQSGVGKPLLPARERWYNRRFTMPANWAGKDITLHFDAVKREKKLWVNGRI